ncbi:MAG: hypothetical protein QM499_05455 [Flavobacteriaceae bacterium]
MIKLFLKAKHWQLFILLFGVPLIFQIFMIASMFIDIKTEGTPNPKYMLDTLLVFPIIMVLFIGIFFGWFWAIAIGLKEKIPKEIKMKTKKFKILFFIPIFYIFFLMIYMAGIFNGLITYRIDSENWVVAIILPLHLLSMFSVFHTMYYVAKTIKTAELKRKIGFGDFAGEFFLLWFYFIGIWIIQTKVNKLAEYNNTVNL